MDIGVPSRFACLKIEDEPASVKSKDNKNDIKKQNTKKNKETETKKAKPAVNSKKDNSKPNRQKEKTNTNKKEKKKENAKEQWEEWKEKDSQLVNGNYEEDLQNAILLSKLDYEEKKEIYKRLEKEAEMEKNRTQAKKKKNKGMSLHQFLGSGGNGDNKEEEEAETVGDVDPDQGFFDKVKQDAQNELNKEEVKELRKKREEKIDEIISLAQLQDKLDKEHKMNEKLKKQLEKAKIEIAAVKERNKSLCDILGHGEMKDKADVLVELERLNSVKNELTEEVTRLHALLEQERSKVAALTEVQHSKHKDKKSKK